MEKPDHKVMIAQCPECETSLRFHRQLRVGQNVTCPECDERLEVRHLSPLVLGWAVDDYGEEYEDHWRDENWD